MNNYHNTVDFENISNDSTKSNPSLLTPLLPQFPDNAHIMDVFPIETQLMTLPVLLPFELDQLLDDNDALMDVIHHLLLARRLGDCLQYIDKLSDNLVVLLNHFETYSRTWHKIVQFSSSNKSPPSNDLHEINIVPNDDSNDSDDEIYCNLNIAFFFYCQQQITRASSILATIHLYTAPTPANLPTTDAHIHVFTDKEKADHYYRQFQHYYAKIHSLRGASMLHMKPVVNTAEIVHSPAEWKEKLAEYKGKFPYHFKHDAMLSHFAKRCKKDKQYNQSGDDHST